MLFEWTKKSYELSFKNKVWKSINGGRGLHKVYFVSVGECKIICPRTNNTLFCLYDILVEYRLSPWISLLGWDEGELLPSGALLHLWNVKKFKKLLHTNNIKIGLIIGQTWMSLHLLLLKSSVIRFKIPSRNHEWHSVCLG